MKRLLPTIILLAVAIVAITYISKVYYNPRHLEAIAKRLVGQNIDQSKLRDGDIIFQTSLSSQSKAIRQATHSNYSHCGIIFRDAGKNFVLEATEPVKLTALAEWVERGQGGHFVVKRLRNAEEVLTPPTLNKMKDIGNAFKGKHYDTYFEWSDDKIYCSELVWKIYKEGAGIEICKPAKLKDFDLSTESVMRQIKDRYGSHIPLDETVVSPSGIYNSEWLTTILSK